MIGVCAKRQQQIGCHGRDQARQNQFFRFDPVAEKAADNLPRTVGNGTGGQRQRGPGFQDSLCFHNLRYDGPVIDPCDITDKVKHHEKDRQIPYPFLFQIQFVPFLSSARELYAP